jgi:hypothetical protein
MLFILLLYRFLHIEGFLDDLVLGTSAERAGGVPYAEQYDGCGYTYQINLVRDMWLISEKGYCVTHHNARRCQAEL